MNPPGDSGPLLARKGAARPSIQREAIASGPQITIPLGRERDARLRLVSLVTGRSSEQIAAEAIDAFLATLPDAEELARQLAASER